MPPDCYKVNVIYYINPYLIWVEVCDDNATKGEYIFEQIGLYGLLPIKSTLDIENDVINFQKCNNWVIAAKTIMVNVLNDSKEVSFTTTYIDRRTSIFDDNIHKYGDLIIKLKNGESRPLSQVLIESNLAYFDANEFHRRLSSGVIKTKLCSTETHDVVIEIEKYYTKNPNSKSTWKKFIKKQTSVFQMFQELESSLTVSNLEKHNNKKLNTVIENKKKDLELCKDINDKSLGRGFRKSIEQSIVSESNSSDTYNPKTQDLDNASHSSANTSKHNAQGLEQVFDNKTSLDTNTRPHDKPSESTSEELRINVDQKKVYPRSMSIEKLKLMHKLRDMNKRNEINKELNSEQQNVKVSDNNASASTSADRPMKIVDNKTAVKSIAYGPPGMNRSHWKIVEVKQEDQGKVAQDVNVGNDANVRDGRVLGSPSLVADGDSDFGVANTNEKTFTDYCNAMKKKIHDNKYVARVTCDDDDSSDKNKSTVSSVLLNKKLKVYGNLAKRSLNGSFPSSDTSTKDSPSVSDSNKNVDIDVSDDIDDVIERLSQKYKAVPSVKNNEKENYVAPIKLNNSVNPFANVDPNISVFVEKLVAPIILVHTKNNKRIQAVFDMRDVFFSPHIHIVLKNMAIVHPMILQSVSWNTILRGHSLFMISPINSGKTLGYLPAVCRLISDLKSSGHDGIGPFCIIVCATAKCVAAVEKLAKMFLTLEDRVLTCYAGCKHSNLTTKLLNGCDLLISTPSSLTRLMQLSEFGVDLRRLSIFVFDDCERLAVAYKDEMKYFLFKIKETVSARVNNELKIQHIFASRVWCDFMKPLAKKVPDTVILFSAFQECVPYAEADASISFIETENKLDVLFDFFNDIDKSKRTVIVCKTDEEVDLLEDTLKRSEHVVFKANNKMTVNDLYKISNLWAEFEDPLVGPILVCCDGNLTHLNITDAHHLVHYSLPHLFSMFGRRFSVLNDNYTSIFKDGKKDVKIKILLDGTNVDQLPKMVKFIKRCTNNSPQFLDEVCSKILKEKDLSKAKNYVPICDKLLVLGSCPDFFNCQERHTIYEEFDSPPEWIPKSGVITFKILHYHTAVLYSAKLLTNVVNGVVTKYPQTYSSLSIKMSMYYSKEWNRRLHGVAKIGDICATSVNHNFFVRCQIVKYLSHYANGDPQNLLVNFIDEEKYDIVSDVCLYYLPDDFKEIITPVVLIRLANVIPRDKDITFSNVPIKKFKKITDNDYIFIKGRVSLTLGNCVFVDTLEACQELTSLNETIVKHDLKQELLNDHGDLNPDRLEDIKKLCIKSGLSYAEDDTAPKTIKNIPKGSWAHLETGIISTVNISSAQNPDKFFVRLDKFDSCLVSLLEEIKQYAETHSSDNKLIQFKEGDLVIAKNPQILTFERARIDCISEDTANCFFVDQGDWKEVPIKQIIPITETLINKLPFQAIECRLIGIQSPCDDWSDYGKNWFINNCFEDNIGCLKHLYIKYFTKETAEFTGGYKYGVALIEMNSDNIVINQSLIRLNLAKENIKEIDYINKWIPDASESNTIQTVEHENSNVTTDNQEVYSVPDDVQSFEEMENEDDDEKINRIRQESINTENNNILLPQPIRSVPLVDSDSSDIDRWDVNMDSNIISTLFPRFMYNIPNNVEQDSDDDTSTGTDEMQAGPSSEGIPKDNNNEPQALDSDDLSSSEVNSTCSLQIDTNNVLNDTNDVPDDANDVPNDADDVPNDANSVTTDANGVSNDANSVTTDANSVPNEANSVITDASDALSDTSVVSNVTLQPYSSPEVEQTRRPKLLWRQTRDIVYIKIQLVDVKDYELEIDVRSIKFRTNLNSVKYEFDIQLYGVIHKNESSHVKTGRYISVKLFKILKTKWISLSKSFDTRHWIVYDIEDIDTSSDEEEVDKTSLENIIKDMRDADDETDDEDFFDDVKDK